MAREGVEERTEPPAAPPAPPSPKPVYVLPQEGTDVGVHPELEHHGPERQRLQLLRREHPRKQAPEVGPVRVEHPLQRRVVELVDPHCLSGTGQVGHCHPLFFSAPPPRVLAYDPALGVFVRVFPGGSKRVLTQFIVFSFSLTVQVVVWCIDSSPAKGRTS